MEGIDVGLVMRQQRVCDLIDFPQAGDEDEGGAGVLLVRCFRGARDLLVELPGACSSAIERCVAGLHRVRHCLSGVDRCSAEKTREAFRVDGRGHRGYTEIFS